MKSFVTILLTMVLFFQCNLDQSQKKELDHSQKENLDQSQEEKINQSQKESQEERNAYEFKSNQKITKKYPLSLAQWSLHRAIESDSISHLEFIPIAAKMGFDAVEYVSTFFYEKANDIEYLTQMNSLAKLSNIKQHLIMVDGEGNLAAANVKERDRSFRFHRKWVRAAQYLGCNSIRVNLFGEMRDVEAWKEYAVDGLTKISTYAASKGINVIVENHGWISSNAEALIEVIETVNMPNCGTLPDFGNFCLERKDGELWGADCLRSYNKYQGVDEMMPYAKAVSAKSYDFDSLGNETTIDFKKMLQIIESHNYEGYIGVEYEGENMTEKEGIIATKLLLEKLMGNE